MGRAITMTLAPLPANKRKRKFAKMEFLPEDPELDHDEHEDEEDAEKEGAEA